MNRILDKKERLRIKSLIEKKKKKGSKIKSQIRKKRGQE